MLDVCLLGTGGMMPLPRRFLTSLMVRCSGSSILIDCGEATQIAMRKKGLSCRKIDTILITHFHADHVSGLAGMLLTMGNSDRVEPVTFIGPKGIDRLLSAVRVMAPELPFEVRYIELTENEMKFQAGADLEISAFRVNHNITCYGYSIELKRKGRFDAARACAQDIPLKYWNRLQKGEIIEEDGRRFTPDMVLGSPRKGLKITYCTDTRPTELIAEYAKGADLFICEGMYGEDLENCNARQYKHMTMQEAAGIARDAGVGELWLTHYSPSVVKPEEYAESVRSIFEKTVFSRDGQEMELKFSEE
ncbi:MAG: ribonuclease Z [Lachnospiraceae bacterium]|jgi:ribonuclease Z